MDEAGERDNQSSESWQEGKKSKAHVERVSDGWMNIPSIITGREEKMVADEGTFVDLGAGR